MKAVAAHAFGVELLRDGEVVGERAMATVESGVETRHLGQLRPKFEDRANRREIVRLVQWRKRNVPRQAIEHFRAHQNGLGIFGTAMHDPMSDRGQVHVLGPAQPLCRDLDRGREVADLLQRKHPVYCDRAVTLRRAQTRSHADPVKLALEQAFDPRSRLVLEQLEFEARRSGVDDENGLHAVTLRSRPRCGGRRPREAPQRRTRPSACGRSLPAR